MFRSRRGECPTNLLLLLITFSLLSLSVSVIITHMCNALLSYVLRVVGGVSFEFKILFMQLMLPFSLSLSFQSDMRNHKFFSFVQRLVKRHPEFKDRLAVRLIFEDRLAVINENPNIKEDLSDEMKIFNYYYYATRCPNWWHGCGCGVPNCIPSDHFDQHDAEAVLCLAQAIVDVMDQILSQRGIGLASI